MAERKASMATGSKELDAEAAKRREERLEEGMEPEKHPGPRQNEGIPSGGQLYASPEEAEAANPSKGRTRDDVDEAAHRGGLGAPEDDAAR